MSALADLERGLTAQRKQTGLPEHNTAEWCTRHAVLGLLAVPSGHAHSKCLLNLPPLETARTACPPVHTPPWQEPLLQTVPFGCNGGAPHSPVALMHRPRYCSHSLRAGQVTPTHMSALGLLQTAFLRLAQKHFFV